MSDTSLSPADTLRLHTDENAEPSSLHAASRLMQRAMVPTTAPRLEGFEVAGGTTLEDDGRGNTTWDHVTLPDGRTAIMVFDVRSDGLPPAHVAGLARAAVRTAARAESQPARLLRTANQALAGMNLDGADQFVECGVLIAGDGAVEWASAGRVPAGVLGRGGTLRRLGSHGPPLGMMDGFGYGEERIETGPGDAVLLLSSGSVGLFRGAADLVAQVHGKPAGEVVKTVHRAIRKAQEGSDRTEEISAVYLRRY